MEIPVLATVFNKSNLSMVLRQYRKSYRLSQQALADDLANNHCLFKNINQSMVSLWEKGTIQPSLNRRVGLANFFKQDYHYDDQEMKVLKKAQKLRSTHAEMSNIYDYNINQIKEFWYEEMSADQKSVIVKAHEAHSGFHFEETLEHIESKRLKIVCFYYNDSLVGHLAFCAEQHGLFKIASLVAIDKQIKLNIFKFRQNISSGFELVIPSFVKYYSHLFSDIYLNDVKTSSPITLHSGRSSSIFSNPFVQFNLSGNDDLILLRYAQKNID